MGQPEEKCHGKGGVAAGSCKCFEKRMLRRGSIIQDTEPLVLVGFEEGDPFIKLVQGNAKPFAQPFVGVKTGKVFSKDAQYKEDAEGGIRYDDIREYGVCMPAAVTEEPEDTQTVFLAPAAYKVDDGTVIIVVDMAVPGAATDGAGLQIRLEQFHVGIKDKF